MQRCKFLIQKINKEVQKFDLHNFRRRNKLTQGELANYLGISGSFLSRIEAGQCALPADKLQRIMTNDKGWLVPEENQGGSEPQAVYVEPKSGPLHDAPIRVDEAHKNVNSTEERLLSLLEEKDRQIDRLLSILEQKK